MFIDSISKKYKKNAPKALDSVSLKIENKGFILLTGKSGSGKSTLINIISGLDTDYQGNVFYKDVNLKDLSRKELTAYRNTEIGFVFQDYCLIENKTVLENLSLPLNMQNIDQQDRIDSILQQFGLSEHKHKYPNELSGGEQQRVSIARALLKNPNIVIADEPTSSLDNTNATMILELLKEISKTKLVIVVSHDTTLVGSFADRVITLNEGSVLSDSNPIDTIVEETSHEFQTFHTTFKQNFSICLKLRLPGFKIIFTLLIFIICFGLFTTGISFATQNKTKLVLQNMYKDKEYTASISLLDTMYRTKKPKYEICRYSKQFIPTKLVDQLLQEKDLELLKTDSFYSSNLPLRDWQSTCDIKITFDEEAIKNGYKINFINDGFYGCLDEDTTLYDSFNFHLIAGAYPTKDTEIALSNLSYYTLKNESQIFKKNKINTPQDLIGQMVEINSKSFTITGIFSVGNINLTRYENLESTALTSKQQLSLLSEIERLKLSAYSPIILNKGYLDKNPFNKQKIMGLPILASSSKQKIYYDDNYTIDTCYTDKEINLKEDKILWFGDPKNHLENNEILLPSSFESQKDIILEDNYDYLCLSSSSLSNYESAMYYNHTPITPVGIYIGDGKEMSLIMSEAKRDEFYDSFGLFGYTSLWIKLTGNIQKDMKLVKLLNQYNLGLNNPYQLMVYEISEFLSLFTSIMMGISCFLLLILIFMLLTYYKTLLHKNKREIGLYFSLGYSGFDVSKPYILHSIFITFITLLPSVGISFAVYNIINNIINNHFNTALTSFSTLWSSLGISIVFYSALSLFIMFLCFKKYFKGNTPLLALKR